MLPKVSQIFFKNLTNTEKKLNRYISFKHSTLKIQIQKPGIAASSSSHFRFSPTSFRPPPSLSTPGNGSSSGIALPAPADNTPDIRSPPHHRYRQPHQSPVTTAPPIQATSPVTSLHLSSPSVHNNTVSCDHTRAITGSKAGRAKLSYLRNYRVFLTLGRPDKGLVARRTVGQP